jgi:hypothetical protein
VGAPYDVHRRPELNAPCLFLLNCAAGICTAGVLLALLAFLLLLGFLSLLEFRPRALLQDRVQFKLLSRRNFGQSRRLVFESHMPGPIEYEGGPRLQSELRPCARYIL